MTDQIVVEPAIWVQTINEQKVKGFVRCEWLTATHLGADSFEVTVRLATEDLDNACLLSAIISDGQIESISSTFPIADFHEREVAQMFGIKFIGNEISHLAFEVEFDGHPLRRDFALSTRVGTEWPGAVEPDASARRRPSLPPGVFEEWQE